MTINIRNKGANGEREICKILNEIVQEVRLKNNLAELEERDLPFQRNQLQTAVGGSDIANSFNLDIEVKRQEQLSINTWWNQVTKVAQRSGGIPILIFKQNRKPWRVIMEANLKLSSDLTGIEVRAEISLDDFKKWFLCYYALHLASGSSF